MNEEIRKRHCGLLFVEMSNSYRSPADRMPLMIDSTSSLENSCINKKDNFVFTSFVGPMQITRTAKGTPLPLDTPTIAESEPSDPKESSPEEKQVKRPPNAFILYRKAKQPIVTAKWGIISNAKISKILSEMWRSESDEERLFWEREADRKKMEHSLKHPGYVYRPRKPKSIEGRKRLNKTSRRKNEMSLIDASIQSHIGQFAISGVNNDVRNDTMFPPLPYYPNIHFSFVDDHCCVNGQSAGRNINELVDSGYILRPEQPMEEWLRTCTDMENFIPANSCESHSFSIQDLAPCSPEEAMVKWSQGQFYQIN